MVKQKDPTGQDPESTLEASSSMNMFGDKYNLFLTLHDGKSGKTREVSLNMPATDFFDNGLVCCDVIESTVIKMLKILTLEKKK